MIEQRRTIDIADRGRLYQVDYDGLLAYHGGEAVFGATAAFRALQAVADALSGGSPWDRRRLSVVSAHSGPGVRDAFEYVTRCVMRNRYRLLDPRRAGQCHSGNRFVWWVGDGDRTCSVELRSDFVPPEFMNIADRIAEGVATRDDVRSLEELKQTLSQRLWEQPLDALFTVSEGSSVLNEQLAAAESIR